MKPEILVRSLISKTNVPKKTGRGQKGYGRIPIARLLIYQQLCPIKTDKGLIQHLSKNPEVIHTLGFGSVPHRTQISRWKKKFCKLLEQLFNSISELVQSLISTKLQPLRLASTCRY